MPHERYGGVLLTFQEFKRGFWYLLAVQPQKGYSASFCSPFRAEKM